MKRLTTMLCALAALTVFMPAVSVGSSTTDVAGLQAIATANTKTANALAVGSCAAERSAVANGGQFCKGDSSCIIAVTAIAALTPCAVVAERHVVSPTTPAAPTIINAAPPPTVGERIVGLFAGGIGKLFDTAVALGPSYMNMRLGTTQSNNATTLGVAQSNNALAAQQSTNGVFAAFGNNLQGTATGGFNALATVGAVPKTITTVTGDGNAVGGSSITNTTTTSTVACPSGDGGNGQGGNGGTAAGGTGTAAAGGVTNCNAGK